MVFSANEAKKEQKMKKLYHLLTKSKKNYYFCYKMKYFKIVYGKKE